MNKTKSYVIYIYIKLWFKIVIILIIFLINYYKTIINTIKLNTNNVLEII